MTTIKEIAKIANVSTATVSYVLNGSDKISEGTRNMVLEVIKSVNYKTNTIAKSLKMKKTNTIGILTEDITVFNTPEIINGINECAEKYNYHIILSNIRLYKRVGNNYKDTAKFADIISEFVDDLISKQVEGIIYVGAHCRDITGLIENKSIPIIYTYCYTKKEDDVSIYYDDEAAAYDITKYLIKQNHTKIGIVTGLLDSVQCQDRLKGYQRALYESNLLFNPEYMKSGDWEFEKGYISGKELLSLTDPPTAIFSMNDIMAGGIIDAANEMNIKIPTDLSLVGFDNRECSYSYSPKLTTMMLPLNEIGIEGTQTLINLINGNAGSNKNIIRLQCKLIERKSVLQMRG
jgi:LacI family transcriptional regulator